MRLKDSSLKMGNTLERKARRLFTAPSLLTVSEKDRGQALKNIRED
jgi:hypothetical protein